jgi:predicted nucleic acid-binding protein
VSEQTVRTLVDSNVLLDLATADARWAPWSQAALAQSSALGALVVNPIIYAEVSVGYARIEELDSAMPEERFEREHLPWGAAFLAGKCYVAYKRRGGTNRSPLPDFYIGAHAAVAGMRLLTRDPSRYRTYFPKLDLIAP